MNEKYAHILFCEHHKSKKYKHMSSVDRAAQFGSFAALTGHSDMIKEEGRFVDKKEELNEEQIFNLNNELNFICENIKNIPSCTVTYFVKDLKKDGGLYVTEKIRVKKIDLVNKILITSDKKEIAVNDIFEILHN